MYVTPELPMSMVRTIPQGGFPGIQYVTNPPLGGWGVQNDFFNSLFDKLLLINKSPSGDIRAIVFYP